MEQFNLHNCTQWLPYSTLATVSQNSTYLEAEMMERCQTFSQDEPIWHQTQRVMIPWLPRQPHPPQRESGPVSCATCPERWNPVEWAKYSDVIVIKILRG